MQLADGDLMRLCEVSKYLHEVTIPRLYESVTLFVTEPRLRSTPCFPVAHLKHTKHVCLKDDLHRHEYNGDWCLYHYHKLRKTEDSFRFALSKERAEAMVNQPALSYLAEWQR